MFEPRITESRQYFLLIDNEMIPMKNKSSSIKIGKKLISLNCSVKLIEKIQIFDISKRKRVIISNNSFDRTNLLLL